MVTSSHSQLNLITEFFSVGFALKHPLWDRDCCKKRTWTCWSSLKNVSDWRFDLPYPTDFCEVKIPVIMVLTKYDLLVVKHLRACSHISSLPDRKVEATKRAKHAFSEVARELKGLGVPVVPVTTRKEEYGGLLIISVTSLFPLK